MKILIEITYILSKTGWLHLSFSTPDLYSVTLVFNLLANTLCLSNFTSANHLQPDLLSLSLFLKLTRLGCLSLWMLSILFLWSVLMLSTGLYSWLIKWADHCSSHSRSLQFHLSQLPTTWFTLSLSFFLNLGKHKSGWNHVCVCECRRSCEERQRAKEQKKERKRKESKKLFQWNYKNREMALIVVLKFGNLIW